MKISSTVSWTSSVRSSVIEFAGASLFSPYLKRSVHLAFTSRLLLTRFPFWSTTVGLYLDLSLHSIFASPYSVFICWLFVASSASSAMFYVHFLLSAFILLLTSLSFSVYFALKVTRPSFFGGYHPTLKLSGIPHLYFYRKSNT